MNQEPVKKIDQVSLAVLNKLCKKSKRICAVCEAKLGAPTKEELANHKGPMWLSSVTMRHPNFKSKKFKLCGYCYSDFKRSREGK